MVTASRSEMPIEHVGASLTVITADEIQQSGYTNLADLLRTTVGVSGSNAGGAGAASVVRIRGEEGFRTKILVDGVDMADPAGVQIYSLIEHISLAEIDRIEILRGPQGMMYGADAGGVVNIITKKADKKFAANLGTEHGSNNTSNNSGNIRGKDGIFDYSVSLANQSTDGFNSSTADVALNDKDGYRNTTMNGRFGVDVTQKLHAQLTLRKVDANHDYDSCGFPATDNCYDTYLQNVTKIDLDHRGENLQQTFSYGVTSTDHDFFADNVKSYYNKGETKQAQYLANVSVTAASNVLLGIDEREDRITDDGSGAGFERDQTGIYSEWQSSIGQQFFYTVGLRNDDNDDFGSYTTYRATAAWLQPLGDNSVKYKASYGTGFRAPSLFEIAYNKGPWAFPPASLTSLKEETSKGYDAGIEYHAASGFFLEAVYFDQQVQDAIYFDLTGFSGYLQESGATDSTGVELSTRIPVSSAVSILGNYTYNDTETSSGDQRIRRPRHSGNVGVKTTVQQWTMLANLRFANGAEDEVSGTRVKLDDYQVLDATLSYAASQQVELYLRGQNLLDNNYEEVAGYNTSGTALYVGFRVNTP